MTMDVYAMVEEFKQQLGILGTRAAEHAAMSKAREKENDALKAKIAELEKQLAAAPKADAPT